jgi:benzoyl-CoA reductase/2-hydroxyglutaryl-CoA dehydratase subunit BcrC/BadD/HgdB
MSRTSRTRLCGDASGGSDASHTGGASRAPGTLGAPGATDSSRTGGASRSPGTSGSPGAIGYACAYTPLPLLEAAGAAPYRLLPVTEAEDRAGRVIHDNMCPHVKRILDRAMAPDLPEIDALLLVNSCDAMRRLADAWRQVRPGDRVALLDLPFGRDEAARGFLAAELQRLLEVLAGWTGRAVGDEALWEAIARHDALAHRLDRLRERQRLGTLPGGSPALQRLVNQVSVRPAKQAMDACDAALAEPPAEPPVPGEPQRPAEPQKPQGAGVPVFLFGNVLPDPAALSLFEDHGARVVADDLCTGSRLIQPVDPQPQEAPLGALSRALLERPACARTITASQPGRLGADVVAAAKGCGARAVIAHVVKFCDPYLARLPAVRQACQQAGLPLLVLEGDCTLRSMGQQATRIEAFVEMLD